MYVYFLHADIIIGAPNEDKGQGAIYIFHYVNREFELVQKVLASETLNTGTLLKGFGSSISTPQDVDSNGTPGTILIKNVKY